MSRMTEQERTDRELLTNSIERVINTSIRIILQSKHEDADMNLSDWVELKSIVVRLWNGARNEAFKRAQK